MQPLLFDELKQEVIKNLDSKTDMVLATSYRDRVTARTMNIINDGLKIYCQTDRIFLKIEQIEKNPNIALSIDNIQIEGTAKILSHPVLDENKDFVELFQKKHNKALKQFKRIKTEVIIEVIPTLITLWKVENNQPFRDYLDILKKDAIREYYYLM